MTCTVQPFVNAQKQRRGAARILHATRFSLRGLRHGWEESAFRLECVLAAFMVPTAFWLGRTWVEVAMMVASVAIVMVVELLNTAIEVTVDRIGPEWHELSARAKDLASGAVMLSVLLAAGIWLSALAHRISGA